METTDTNLEPVNTVETLGTTPKYVLQHNAISRSAHNLSATAQKLTAMAMALLPPDLSSRTASFTFTEFCDAIGFDKGGESFKLFKSAIDECMKNYIAIERVDVTTGKKEWENYTWFVHSFLSERTGIATMTFSNELASVILALKNVYAKINLKDLGALQSKYALRIFEMAVSYMSLRGQGGNPSEEWYFERTIQDLRKMFELPDNVYNDIRNFKKKVIELPVKEINEARIGVEISTTGIKKGRNLTGIRFDCQKTVRKVTPKRGRKKKEANEQFELPDVTDGTYLEKSLERLKEVHAEEFAELYSAELSKDSFLPPTNEMRKAAAEVHALTQLKEKYGLVK